MLRELPKKPVGEAFLCPFCGAPYHEVISAGTDHVECPYCGHSILTSSRHGKESEKCTNHPEVQAVGFCYDCGRLFCEQCLKIIERKTAGSDQPRKSPLCLQCISRIEREKIAHKRNRRNTLGFIALSVIIVSTLIGYAIYTQSFPTGAARRNWSALGSVTGGVNIMITPMDPRQMNETDLNRYFTSQGTSQDYVSIVVHGNNLAEIKYEGARIQPYMKHIEVSVTKYTCGSGGMLANQIPTPHEETSTVFIGKLSPGEYTVSILIRYGGAIAYYCTGGSCYKVFSSGSGGGGTSTSQKSFTIS